MGYVLEEITPEDREKILKDVGESTARMLVRRGGFDEEEMRLMKKNWTVDREKNSYLMTAPNMAAPANTFYYFFFEGVIYQFEIRSHGWKVHFEKKPSEPLYERIKAEILLAFSVFGELGIKGRIDRFFNPVFEDE